MEAIRTLHVRSSGTWSPRHVVSEDGAPLGVLAVRRNRWGLVVSAEYRPEKGEVLLVRRDPGLLRAQFSIWTEGREWLGSSLRWSLLRRHVELWTSGKPYRLVPLPGLRRGWRLVASKTGEVARFDHGLAGRTARIELYRKTDLEMVLFAFFLGTLGLVESAFPTTLETTSGSDGTPAASEA